MVKLVHTAFWLVLIATISVSLNLPSPPPPGPIGPFLNGILPTSTPSEGGSWELEDPWPTFDIASPVLLIPMPNTSDLLLLSKLGEVWKVSIENNEKQLLLDLAGRAYYKGDAGATGLVLHPKFGDPAFPDKQLIFVQYRHTPTPSSWTEWGYNRISSFKWDKAQQKFDENSEEIFIQQYDRSSWHNGGGMFFGKDGFLYISVGDEGQKEFQTVSTQRLDGGLFSGILRIDIDNDPLRSHPIRRQPSQNGSLPGGWTEETYTQGYSIPNDNPWLDENGDVLEEYFALGIRSPFGTYYDPETELIWLADVGDGSREEVNIIRKGDNLQWPYLEGTFPSEVHTKPDPFIGNEQPVYFEYDRSIGSCVIGGSIYKGNTFTKLNGKYLFADYSRNKIMAITTDPDDAEPELTTIINNLAGQPVEVPEAAGITGVFPIANGDILITVMPNYETPEQPGKILRLKQKGAVPEPPSKLSDLGAFTDLTSLTPAPGILPYSVNSPLWSDRALKQRWISIPNDGSFDGTDEQIRFNSTEDWTFPEGTVFIKHFELPFSEDPNAPRVRLETRFFVIGEDKVGYGITYKWNEEGTEAFLLAGAATSDFEVEIDGGIEIQTWNFPSREQCMTCHNANANYVLGVKTHQLNGEIYYPDHGFEMNQLEYLNQNGMFQYDIGSANDHKMTYAIDDQSANLELRIRSYLDANCSSCHRQEGVPMLTMDLRYNVPLTLQNLVNFPTQSHASNPNNLLIEPGNYSDSELYIRDESMGENRMPPIARNLVDEVYIDALIEWIGSLPEDYGKLEEVLLYPNPAQDAVALRIPDEWAPPYTFRILDNAGRHLRNNFSESKSVRLDIHDLPAGMYLIQMSDNNGTVSSKQLVVK